MKVLESIYRGNYLMQKEIGGESEREREREGGGFAIKANPPSKAGQGKARQAERNETFQKGITSVSRLGSSLEPLNLSKEFQFGKPDILLWCLAPGLYPRTHTNLHPLSLTATALRHPSLKARSSPCPTPCSWYLCSKLIPSPSHSPLPLPTIGSVHCVSTGHSMRSPRTDVQLPLPDFYYPTMHVHVFCILKLLTIGQTSAPAPAESRSTTSARPLRSGDPKREGTVERGQPLQQKTPWAAAAAASWPTPLAPLIWQLGVLLAADD